MNMPLRRAVNLILPVILLLGVPAVANGQTYTFANKSGDGPSQSDTEFPTQPGPLDRVRKAAKDRLAESNCGLTRDQLVYMTLPPTWREVAQESGTTPHPMALSRHDTLDQGDNQRLYYNPNGSQTFDNDHHRIYWHPGLGTWQLDDTNVKGKDLASGRFRPYEAMADLIADRYCAVAGSTSWAAHVYEPWPISCGDAGVLCKQIYDQLVENPSSLAANMNTAYWGNIMQRVCQFRRQQDHEDPNHEPPRARCYYVNPLGDARPGSPYDEGIGRGGTDVDANGGWIHDDGQGGGTDEFDGGAGGNDVSPLAKPFYILSRTPEGGVARENRVWLKEDLNDPFFNNVPFGVTGGRNMGAGSRETLEYSPGTSICDITESPHRGNC